MTTFIETPTFPDDIAEGSGGGAGFSTDVFIGMNGTEQRNQNWELLRGQYNVAYGIRDKDAMDIVRAFFINCRGKALGFRFKDWGDYTLDGEACVGTADGTNKVFRLAKTYAGGNPYIRRIFKPRADTVVVYDNGTAATLTTDYTLDDTTGTITFVTAPASGHVITADGEFDIAARFDTDQMMSVQDGFITEDWSNIPIIEIKLEDPS